MRSAARENACHSSKASARSSRPTGMVDVTVVENAVCVPSVADTVSVERVIVALSGVSIFGAA